MQRLRKINKPIVMYLGESCNTAGKLAIYRIRKSNGSFTFRIIIREMIINQMYEFVEYMKINFSSFHEALESLTALVFYNTLPVTVHPDCVEGFKEYILSNMISIIEEPPDDEADDDEADDDEARDNLRLWIERFNALIK